jgi:anti-sigma factor RsiW
MKCAALEPLIALYAGRDLEGPDAARVEAHVAECAACRELLEELQSSQSALRELGSEPVDAALLTAVRAGVMAGIGGRRRVVWPWAAGFAAAALVAGLVVQPRKRIEQPVPVAQPRRVVIALPAIETPPEPVPGRVVKRRAPKPKAEQPLVVKMLTDDPDIVIIWLVDQRGD